MPTKIIQPGDLLLDLVDSSNKKFILLKRNLRDSRNGRKYSVRGAYNLVETLSKRGPFTFKITPRAKEILKEYELEHYPQRDLISNQDISSLEKIAKNYS